MTTSPSPAPIQANRTRLHIRAAALLGGLAMLSGCAGAGPSDLDTPNVLWPDGEPTGEFENDPAVIALREAWLEHAVAWNALDYSDPDRVYRWGLGIEIVDGSVPIVRQAAGWIDSGASDPDEWTMLGPEPLEILAVDLYEDRTEVVVCMGSEFVQRDYVTDEVKEFQNLTRGYSVEMFPDGSSIIEPVSSSDNFNQTLFKQCREANLSRPVFDPPPELFSGDESDIKYPVDPQEYGFDNVS